VTVRFSRGTILIHFAEFARISGSSGNLKTLVFSYGKSLVPRQFPRHPGTQQFSSMIPVGLTVKACNQQQISSNKINNISAYLPKNIQKK
jgi:hypothetical protein